MISYIREIYIGEEEVDMLKILFLIHDLGQGGAEKVLVNLVNNMDQTKFSITVVSLFGGGVNEQFLAPHIRYHASFKRSFPANSYIMKAFSPKQLHGFFIKEKYDIEVAYLEGPSARIISGCHNKETKLVSWIHCTMHSEKNVAESFRSIQEAKNCYNRFHYMVYVSKTCEKAFQEFCPTRGNNVVLYNTNDSDAIRNSAKRKIDDKEFSSDAFLWCGMGKLIPVKAFDRMLRIQERLISGGRNVHLFILGDGPIKGELEKWCSDHGISSSVTFLGYQTNPYKYLAKCDLFVCSSHSEGFSTAATEALIVGVPVCSVEVSGMREMLGENNEYGVITENNEEDLYEAIQSLVDNPKLLTQYKTKAKKRGDDFTMSKTVKTVEDFFLRMRGTD